MIYKIISKYIIFFFIILTLYQINVCVLKILGFNLKNK